MDELKPPQASELLRLTLGHVRREYPHMQALRIESASDLAPPHVLHPVFYGSYDWHSCVHGYWLLARLLEQFPALPEAAEVVALFDQQLTPARVAGEVAFMQAPSRASFERPYGWVWLLKLDTALQTLSYLQTGAWRAALAPLVALILQRWMAYLPKLAFPIRSGVHNNSAFALLLTLDYAESLEHDGLRTLVVGKARQFFLADCACQAWEPGGEDFLSPAWQEAVLMSRVLSADEFVAWFSAFLPELEQRRPEGLLQPVGSTDRSDGRLAHLDGLNLSRAWCQRLLALRLAERDPRRALLEQSARMHLRAGGQHLRGDYMGEHWLATFLLLALEA